MKLKVTSLKKQYTPYYRREKEDKVCKCGEVLRGNYVEIEKGRGLKSKFECMRCYYENDNR